MVVRIQEKQFQQRHNYRQFDITVDHPNSRHTLIATLTSDPLYVDEWIRTTLPQNEANLNHGIIGLGVQWSLPDARETALPATIQLCIRRSCLIFHAIQSRIFPWSLRKLFSDVNYTFVGLHNGYDAFKINLIVKNRNPHRLGNTQTLLPGMPIDLRFHVLDNQRMPYLRYCSIKQIVRDVLGFELAYNDEGEVMFSNWEIRHLSPEQVGYASVDAYVSYCIGVRLRAWGLNPYRSSRI